MRSSGADKRKWIVVLKCTGDGEMLPALKIFKRKRKLKSKHPNDVHNTVQAKSWMDDKVVLRWFKAIILPYIHVHVKVKKKEALLVMDSFSAHKSENS